MERRFSMLIVEDEAIIARDLARMMAAAGYRVLGPVGAGEAAIEHAATGRPDLLLMDVKIAGRMDGIEAARSIWREFMIPAVFVTAHADEPLVNRAAHPGVLGYILKPFDERQLLASVALARARCEAERPGWERVWQQEVLAEAFGRITVEVESARRRATRPQPTPSRTTSPPVPVSDLTTREREVVRLLMDNHRVPAIAEALFISQHTVRNHLKSVYRKVGVGSQTELIERVRHSFSQLL